MAEVLESIFQISEHSMEVRVNPAFVRNNEVKVLLGNRDKLDKVVGHVDGFPLASTLRWMLEGD